MGDAPQSLLFPVRCPACGRPGREQVSCPWCGERSPVAPRTRGDLARLAAGFALLVAASVGIANGPVAAVALFSGFFLALSKPPSERKTVKNADTLFKRTLGEAGWGSLSAALLSSAFALGFRFFAVPYPLPAATRFAWFFPALAAACFALRVPAEEPDAPVSGDPARVRALRRHAPDLAAALSLAPFAAVFAARGPSLLSLVGLALVLGVWFARLARPAAPLLLSAVFFSLLLPDPAFLAYGLLASAAVRRSR